MTEFCERGRYREEEERALVANHINLSLTTDTTGVVCLLYIIFVPTTQHVRFVLFGTSEPTDGAAVAKRMFFFIPCLYPNERKN